MSRGKMKIVREGGTEGGRERGGTDSDKRGEMKVGRERGGGARGEGRER